MVICQVDRRLVVDVDRDGLEYKLAGDGFYHVQEPEHFTDYPGQGHILGFGRA